MNLPKPPAADADPTSTPDARRFQRNLWLGVLALNLFVAAFASYFLYSSWRSHVELARTTTQNLSLTLEREVTGLFDHIDLALQVLAEIHSDYSRLDRFPVDAWNRALLRQRQLQPILDGIRGINATGEIEFGVDEKGPAHINVADREYFVTQRDKPDAGLAISRPLQARITRKWSLVLSRRLNDKHDNFSGIVAATLPLEHFSALFTDLKVGESGSIGLRDADLGLIVRQPALTNGEAAGSTRIASEFTAALLRDRIRGTYRAGSSSIDGVQRVHSYRRGATYPFYINVGIADREYLAPWRTELALVGSIGGLFLLVTVLSALRFQRAWKLQRLASAQIRRSEADYRILVDEAPYGIALLNADGSIAYVNPAFTRMLGYTLEDIPDIAAWWDKAYPDPDYRQRVIDAWQADVIAPPSPLTLQSTVKLHRSDGMQRSIRSMIVKMEGGRITNTFEDITDSEKQRSRLAEALEAAEAANLAKSRFLAAASHDLRQPMQAINLFCNALSSTELNAEQKQISDYLNQSARNLGDLLNALLDISRFDAGLVGSDPQAIQVESLFRGVAAAFSPIASEKGLRFRLRAPPRKLALLADAKLLSSLLANLVGNAIKYTERGGVLVGIRRRGHRALIQVWDTGIGIAPEHLDNIFQEYFQVANQERDRTKGLGLGLSIARRISKLLATEVVCRSRPGRGSVFEFGLPLADALPQSATDGDMPGSAPASAPTPRRVVVIEDDIEVATALRLSLSSRGMRVTTYANAEAALANPDIADAEFFISDLRLPGMNGRDFLEAIQAGSKRPIKAVILTGDTAPERVELARSSRWSVLFKPVDVPKLLAALTLQDSGER